MLFKSTDQLRSWWLRLESAPASVTSHIKIILMLVDGKNGTETFIDELLT